MATLKRIPITNDAYATFSTTINGHLVDITQRYNEKMNMFMVDISVPDHEKTVKGIPVSSGVPLFIPYNLDLDKVYATDTARVDSSSTRENFGDTYQIVVMVEDEQQ
jgi:hypothetical protein